MFVAETRDTVAMRTISAYASVLRSLLLPGACGVTYAPCSAGWGALGFRKNSADSKS